MLSASASADARAVAELAALYAYPMLVGYGYLHTQVSDPSSSMHQGMNRLHHFRQLGGPARLNTIPWINNDTPYGAGWLDLRAEPFVLSLPEFSPGRFHNVQLLDLYTHNFAYFGTRTSGNAAQQVLIAGPDWQGTLPAGMQLARAETQLVKIVTRILLEGGESAEAVQALEDRYGLQPLSQHLGHAPPPAPPPIHFITPGHDPRTRFEPAGTDFIAPLNFMLSLCRPPAEEQPLLQGFQRIGIAAGQAFDEQQLAPALSKAIADGVAAAHRRIEAKAARLDDRINGWEMPLHLRGSRARMAADEAALLNRAAAARYAIWGVDAEEGLYMVSDEDAQGQPLDGAAHRYTLHFEQPPPVRAFWSFTVYDAATRCLVAHSSGRYAVRDRDPGLQRELDGGFTLQLQHDAPAGGANANWLPVPARPFQVVARLYWPCAELLDGRYRPPPIERLE
ncbi:DUF1254 domain-containing protein [Aquabacterium sp.]|uniref:DUF1254 domain-containing protein n=1 Tax=Aquabacterium sp. TaxID=1872578 RepID=UPI002D082E11|nr:DUF1254 domain-containing protein [Aquabacterium sp.]HSW03559.1 DUF1254 domain-containing protein [Aquabacterium sp.]